MYQFEYEVSLRIRHPVIDADVICKEVGLEAEHKWTVGEQRKTPDGHPLGGINKSTYCCFRLAHPIDLGLVEFLNMCNDRLHSHANFFRRIRETGGSSEYFIGWFCDRNCGEVFDLEFMSNLVSLQIDLSIDFYGGSIPSRK